VDQRITGTAIPAGGPVPNDGFGYGIMDLPRAVNASAYPVPASGFGSGLTSVADYASREQGGTG